MSKWKKIKGKTKNSIKAYRHGLFNFRKLVKFMKIAPSDVEENDVPHLTVFEVKDQLANNNLHIIDIRSKNDFLSAHIDGSIQMDMFTLFDNLDKLDELPKDRNIGMLCYGGGASLTVTQMLIDRGFTNVKNIKGGIIRYALDVDDSLLGNL